MLSSHFHLFGDRAEAHEQHLIVTGKCSPQKDLARFRRRKLASDRVQMYPQPINGFPTWVEFQQTFAGSLVAFLVEVKDEINVPIALSAFGDKGSRLWSFSEQSRIQAGCHMTSGRHVGRTCMATDVICVL